MKEAKAGPVALRYLSYRDRTVKEVADHLEKKGFQPEAIASTLDKLARLGYLNDERFALTWGRSRLEGKKIGRRRLALELKARGLDQSTVERALAALFTEIDEWDLALSAGQKKLSALGGVDGDKKKRRLVHYLQRRGFSIDTVLKVMRELPVESATSSGHEANPEAASQAPDPD